MKCFKIDYKIGFKTADGGIEPLSKAIGAYTANIVAKTPDIARERLREMFSMAYVDIIGCRENEISVEEYLREDRL